jgi:hypothetical protein
MLSTMTLMLMLGTPFDALAEDSSEPAATFNERFPADQNATPPPSEIRPNKNRPQGPAGSQRLTWVVGVADRRAAIGPILRAQ